MIVLGVWDGTPSSAALVIDGKLISSVAEERLTRNKNEYGYPLRSIQSVLDTGGISIEDVDYVAMSTASLSPTYFYTLRNKTFSINDYWKEQNEYWYPKFYQGKNPSYLDVFSHRVDSKFPYDKSLIKDETDSEGMINARVDHLCRTLGVSKDVVSVHDHHTCHAYYGYIASTDRHAEDTLVYTMDGNGDKSNGTVWLGRKGKKLELISRTNNCNIGRMYRYATLLLGMRPADHEYKVMGLAAYNSHRYGKEAYQIYADTLEVDGLDFKYKKKIKDHFFYFKERLEGQRFDAIAYGIQKRTEELLTEWIANGVKMTGVGNVVMSGGVAQNIKANKLIVEMDGVNKLLVPPGPGDESLALGAAYVTLVEKGVCINDIESIPNAFFGPKYNKKDIEDAIQTSICSKMHVHKVSNLEVAEKLANGEVIARFGEDRMEFGARALGNRSIIADPRRSDVIHHINKLVKMRDFWMPFAPSILEERIDDYMINPKKINSKFMSVGFDSTPLAQSHLPAGLHPFDRSARPQVVTKKDNPKYHELIKAFEDLTGVGALLNTSFNIHGEPIVCTPQDAIDTFNRCGLKHLLLGEYLISKTQKNSTAI